jgi:hypothetical protein
MKSRDDSEVRQDHINSGGRRASDPREGPNELRAEAYAYAYGGAAGMGGPLSPRYIMSGIVLKGRRVGVLLVSEVQTTIPRD